MRVIFYANSEEKKDTKHDDDDDDNDDNSNSKRDGFLFEIIFKKINNFHEENLMKISHWLKF